jgi:hypothetical protein
MKSFYQLSIRALVFGHFFSFFFISVNYCFSAGLIQHSSSKAASGQNNSGDLFNSNEILKLTILSDFSSIMKDRGEDRSYHKGQLYYVNLHGDTIKRKIKLKTRGNFRRDPDNCKYPPIKLKFSKLNTADSIFADQSTLKLVTQCQLENYVLLEYLAYRIYNQLTDFSYRVSLAHITYADLETKKAYFTRYAFLIESEKEMAARINAEIYKPNVVQYFLERDNAITMAMFQYLIGNNDWFVTSKHNTSILKLNTSEELIAVPYDFDWSKFVDASYTKPEGAPAKSLAERRVYKGLCINSEEYEIQLNLYNSKKEEFMELIESVNDLPNKTKQQSSTFINKFYKTINRPSSLPNIFQKDECVKKSIYDKK